MCVARAALFDIFRPRGTVVCARYSLGQREQTLREIAPRLAVSADRVRQIEQESPAKLYGAFAGGGTR